MVMVIGLIKELWDLKEGTVTLRCDGINTLHQALEFKYNPTSASQHQFDLLSGIQGYILYGTISYTPKYVKWHQDDILDINKLNRWALLNIEVDFWAKEFLGRNIRT